MAWIGMPDPATRAIRPVASYGEVDGYFDKIPRSGDDDLEGHGPTGVAFPFATASGTAVLTLFAPGTGFFDEQITGLLHEMTRDLTYALKALNDDEERRRSEVALSKKNEELLAANEQLTAQEEELRQSL